MGEKSRPSDTPLSDQDIPLDRGLFMADVGRTMAAHLQRVVGGVEAEGYVSGVGAEIGERVKAQYEAVFEGDPPKERLSEVLVDLKRRIGGEFSVAETSDEEFVLVNTRCPFGDQVEGKPSLCMMTSNVFGVIAAESAGYARVDLDRTIAEGHGMCRVRVRLTTGGDDTPGPRAREYYGG